MVVETTFLDQYVDEVRYSDCDTGINGSPFHQHLFDCTPLLEQELV
jgi:hypothetical protein